MPPDPEHPDPGRTGGRPWPAPRWFRAAAPELRRVAINELKREAPGGTLQATALVNEAFLRLHNNNGQTWVSTRFFLAAAKRTMRRILMEHARKRPPRAALPADVADRRDELANRLTTEIEELLGRLALTKPGPAAAVRFRLFTTLTWPQIAERTGVSQATVRRHWDVGIAWLGVEMARGRRGRDA